MPRAELSRSRLVVAVTVLCRSVLVACNVVTIYTTVGALLIDGQLNIEDASIMAGFGAIFAAVTGFLTLTVVRLVGVRWLILPAIVFAVAFARGLYLDTVYPPPPGL